MGYIVSGIGPSDGGVGRLVRRLSVIAPQYGYVLMSRRVPRSVRGYLRQGKINQAVLEVVRRYREKQIFNRDVARIRNAHVIAIHPQTLFYDNLFKLIDNGNRVAIYIMDNSYFCIRSYNHLPGDFQPCFRCLGGSFNLAEKCNPFPLSYEKAKNISYLQKLLRYKDRFHFILQNKNQLALLERHFGDVSSSIVGLYIADMLDAVEIALNSHGKYDVVYHAAAIEPKGILYTLHLAKMVPERTFFIPDSKTTLVALCEQHGIDLGEYQNLVLKNVTWESGLASIVRQAGLVICPSLWSAPIEGALIKSLFHNGKVAVVDTKFSFAQELPEDVALKLPADIAQAAVLVENYFKGRGCAERLQMNACRWVEGYLDQAETLTARLFSGAGEL